MLVGRQWFGAAVLDGKIFVSGGLFHETEELKSAEYYGYYDSSWSWKPFVDLPMPLDGHSMVSDGSGIFLLGGGNNGKMVPTVYKINPNAENPEWEQLPSMKKGRHVFRAEVLGNKLIAIGGYKQKSTEIFDGTSWTYGPDLPDTLVGHSSIVIPSHLALKLSQWNKN